VTVVDIHQSACGPFCDGAELGIVVNAFPYFYSLAVAHAVAKAPSGPQWVHEIKFDGYRMAARIDSGKVQLLTRSGLDWTAKVFTANSWLNRQGQQRSSAVGGPRDS
jgi:hypothetical protein